MKRMSVVAFLAVLLASLGANAYAQFNVFSIPQKSGIITASDCSGYTSLGQLCQDTDDGKLYKGTGSAIEEISGTGVSTYAEIEALADYPAVVVSEGTITADHSVCWNDDGTAVISCGAPVNMAESIATGLLYYNSVSGEVENAIIKIAVFNIPGTSEDGTVIDSYVPQAATITGVVVTTTGAACSAVVDIWSQPYADFPPENGQSITAAAPPTLTTAQMSKDTTLTGWTTTVPADSVLRANLDSSDCTGIITVTLYGR